MSKALSKEFIRRRRINWLSLAFLYGSFYALRYNLSLANKSICDEYGFSNAQFGLIITATYVAYAIGQFVNGPIVDRFGGKKMMLFGAAGTIIANILFGISAYTGVLNLFVAVWVLNGYMQAYGSPGNLKVNGSWFDTKERGLFAGIFTAVVYCGRLAIMIFGPLIIAKYHWKWVFIAPALVTVLVSLVVLFFVKETPKEAGFDDIDFAQSKVEEGSHVGFLTSLKIVLSNKYMWIMGFAYLSTGVVRNGLEQWFPKYLQEVHNIMPGSVKFGAQAVLMPIAALSGAIVAGWISDRLFAARRGPIVAIMYFAQAILLLLFIFAINPLWCGILLIILSFMFSGPHSIVGSAVAMDFGGREATATAHGFVDAMQYVGASLVGVVMGKIIDIFGWKGWGPSLIAFAVMGGLLMCLVWNVKGDQVACKTRGKN
ncbi:MAG TPA: MFS transporter [bacterium]|nr:MFS transporter [Myxococcales bacterium]OQA61418.1 MAG: Regulatory protein UhpC [bacterium ADurb.Bin270]HPW45635.1 MFS transporter [bacterium]